MREVITDQEREHACKRTRSRAATYLEKWVSEMFLVVLDERDPSLEVFLPSLIPKLAHMSTGLSCFASIPRLDDIGTR